MKTLMKLKRLQAAGAKINSNGLENFSRYQTARLLGLSQISQFDNPKTLRLDIGCWMLGELSGELLISQQEFVDEYIFPLTEPGSVSDLDILTDVVSSSRVNDQTKKIIIDHLHCGDSIDNAGLTAIQKQNLKKALENVGEKLKVSLGQGFSIGKLLPRLQDRLKVLSPSMFIQILSEASLDRTERVLSGEVNLESNELATIYLATLIPTESLRHFEEIIAEMLGTIEQFRHDYYVLIKKLSPLIVEGSGPNNPPFWIRFFDHDKRAKAPSMTDLITVYQGVKDLSEKSSEEIKSELREHFGENSRVRVFELGKVSNLIKSKNISLSEAHRELKLTVDIAQFYRTYKAWEKESAYTEYWKIDYE